MAVVALNNWRDRNDWPETIVILIAVWAIVARCARP
jgi:hypothetical protein